jgi:hypothetical protein
MWKSASCKARRCSRKCKGKWSTWSRPRANAAVVKRNDDGTSTLAGARFEQAKFALELGESSDGMQPGSSK